MTPAAAVATGSACSPAAEAASRSSADAGAGSTPKYISWRQDAELLARRARLRELSDEIRPKLVADLANWCDRHGPRSERREVTDARRRIAEIDADILAASADIRSQMIAAGAVAARQLQPDVDDANRRLIKCAESVLAPIAETLAAARKVRALRELEARDFPNTTAEPCALTRSPLAVLPSTIQALDAAARELRRICNEGA